MKTINRYILTAAMGSMLFVSCKKDFLDINDNPNSPSKVEVKDVLPSAELAIGHAMGNNFQVYGCIWGEYWTQNPYSSQYKTLEQYSPAADDFDAPWRLCYSDALQDLNYVVKKGTEEGKFQYVACAKILQAYTYQVLTDNFGDIPFSDALKGEDGVISPKYDTQKDVYDGIIKLIDDGLALIDPSATDGPTTDDILLGGDMTMWTKFANTLKLRVYLRMAYVDAAKAQAGIASMASATFLGAGENVQIKYTSTPGNTNPYYSVFSEINGTQNFVASSTCLDTMYNWFDDRIAVVYTPLSNGSFQGNAQGDYTSNIPVTSLSLPGAITGANVNDATSANAPVKLMSDYESLFLQAEAAARTWLPGTAQTFYESGITASYVDCGLSDTLAPYYFAQPQVAYPASGTVAQQVEAIITQKWFAMCGTQGNEAWTEYRRTGYPSFLVPSVHSIIGPGKMPNRMFYPSSELTRNPNVPAQHLIYDKVWWDVN
ncbi:MAG: SusD/RagB family nutrient-binding outer membrane lipoprotein [Bacteroidetes bacterium]|nr:SusD/RagB family nutrient-binding outer membrane lipoprotein [Bacteroidota bacterium]